MTNSQKTEVLSAEQMDTHIRGESANINVIDFDPSEGKGCKKCPVVILNSMPNNKNTPSILQGLLREARNGLSKSKTIADKQCPPVLGDKFQSLEIQEELPDCDGLGTCLRECKRAFQELNFFHLPLTIYNQLEKIPGMQIVLNDIFPLELLDGNSLTKDPKTNDKRHYRVIDPLLSDLIEHNKTEVAHNQIDTTGYDPDAIKKLIPEVWLKRWSYSEEKTT